MGMGADRGNVKGRKWFKAKKLCFRANKAGRDQETDQTDEKHGPCI